MRIRNIVYLLIGSFVVLAAATTLYFKAKSKTVMANVANPHPSQTAAGSEPRPQAAVDQDSQPDVALTVTNFLANLTPGGTAESAGRERTYVVSYQVAFFRKVPSEKAAEESLTYKELQERDVEKMPPYVYYGENVKGTFDPAHPGSIAVHASIDGKEVEGYVDSSKLWLEPPLQRADSDRYMALKDSTSVYVVPDPASPPVLKILQGEVVETLGQLDFRGRRWIKTRFNAKSRPRYGFVLGSDVTALTFSTVNQSVVKIEEIPKRIRHSGLTFAESDRRRLSQNGFYVETVPPIEDLSADDMADSYQQSGPQYFITSDLYLHAFHLIFDRMMQDIEEKKFSPAVSRMSGNLARAAESELKSVPPSQPQVRDALLTDLVYFSVAARLFGPIPVRVPDSLEPQVNALVSAIEAGGGELPSATNFIGPEKEDFTQYKVRGHYAKNQTLQQYFRGMMWFGRHNFLLSDSKQTLAAILLPSIVEAAGEKETFDSLDALITYLIGRQDKYTLAGYRAVNQKVFGTEAPSLQQLTANLDENIATFQRIAARDLPAPQIVSAQTGIGLTQDARLLQTAGFKFLGQRYVLDAFILNQLTSPSVGSDAIPRNLPSGLDVMMLLGSKAATDTQQQVQREHKWPNYEEQIAKVRGLADAQLAKRATFYEQWLSALKTLFLPTASKQFFALGEPWQYKNLNAGLASWTELKHDTILYAEQSAAEAGEGGEFEIPVYEAPGPKGYVEPNPAFFDQLAQTVDQLIALLTGTMFGSEEYLDKFIRYRDLVRQADAIAHKEVAGEPITPEEYEWIASMDHDFDASLLLPRDTDPSAIKDKSNLQMALIADVATDNVQGRVLEEGIGIPQRIVVVVKDASGGTRLTVGYMYSWYEFDSTKRWSDAEWKKIIYSKDGAAMKAQGIKPPGWYSTFLKTVSGGS